MAHVIGIGAYRLSDDRGDVRLRFHEFRPKPWVKPDYVVQHAAPEVLRIQVLQVSVQPDGDASRDVTMLAEVLKVGRSQTSLKADDMVTIKYKLTTHPAGWVGPGDVPVLKENTETVAYLSKAANSENYAPAAGAMSFDQF